MDPVGYSVAAEEPSIALPWRHPRLRRIQSGYKAVRSAREETKYQASSRRRDRSVAHWGVKV